MAVRGVVWLSSSRSSWESMGGHGTRGPKEGGCTLSEAVERAQTQTWQREDAGAAWQRTQAQRAQFMGPATELMLDLVGLKAGDRVLDIAAGTGDQSIAAAQRVGPSGHVVATDLSSSMLAAAQKAAADA